ncbi:probable methylmalonate-semialdehyde dehydrogenase, mitochondrial [Trichonephila clavipes]|nr:probable methylmalonate-semialdehyde dehydrogenase, mitochondrial [Trichonephila clavipes]
MGKYLESLLLARRLHLIKYGTFSRSMASVPNTKMFIDGKFIESKATQWIDLHNPATNEVVTRVPKCTNEEMESAVESCKKAFKTWSNTSILSRQQSMFRLQHLIKQNMDSSLVHFYVLLALKDCLLSKYFLSLMCGKVCSPVGKLSSPIYCILP